MEVIPVIGLPHQDKGKLVATDSGNRKPLNKGYIHLKGFHLENLSSIIPLLEEGMYVIGGRKYDEVDYQFKVLPFGFQQSLGCSQGYRFSGDREFWYSLTPMTGWL